MPESKTTPAPEGKKNDAPVTAAPTSSGQKKTAPAKTDAAAPTPKQPESKPNVPPKEQPKVPPAPPTAPPPPPKTPPPKQAEEKGKATPDKKTEPPKQAAPAVKNPEEKDGKGKTPEDPKKEQPKKNDTPKPAPPVEPKKEPATAPKKPGEKAAPGNAAKDAATPDPKKDAPAPPAADPKEKAPADPKQPETKTPAADPKGKSADAPKVEENKGPIKVDGKSKVEIPVEPKGKEEDTKAAPAGDTPLTPAQKGGQTRKERNQATRDFMDGKATIDGKPIEPLKSAPIGEPKAETAAGPVQKTEGPKGLAITQIFADRLEKPTQKDLESLPIPQEGEGFSMRLHPAYFFEFLDHPFSVNRETQDYKELFDSIKENGINEPIKARPREGGGLELISGHRRHDVAMQLNYPVPVVIVQADDDTAQIEVVDGNLHRLDIPTSELARAAKMKIAAMGRKVGRRSKMDQLAGPQKRTDQLVAEEMAMSRTQLTRLVRIDPLVPEMKKMVDDKTLPFNVAVELSHMTEQEQQDLVGVMKKEQTVPSLAQALQMKEASQKAAKAAKEAAKAPKPPLQVVSPQASTEPSQQPTAQAANINDTTTSPPAATAPTQAVSAPSAPPPAPAPKPPAPVDAKKFASIMKNKPEPELKVTFTGAELKDFFPGKTPTVPEVKTAVFEGLGMRKRAQERKEQKQAITNPTR